MYRMSSEGERERRRERGIKGGREKRVTNRRFDAVAGVDTDLVLHAGKVRLRIAT